MGSSVVPRQHFNTLEKVQKFDIREAQGGGDKLKWVIRQPSSKNKWMKGARKWWRNQKEGTLGGAMEGVASIALLPCGSLSGHFIHRQDSVNVCFGLQGTELACEKECSRGEDYRLIKLAIIDFNRKKEKVVVVECRGHDAARLQSIDHAHGWEEDVVDLVEEQHGKNKVLVSFNCETLKSDAAAEDHIRKFLPKLAGLDAVVNIGRMTISGLDFEAEE